MAKKKQDDVGSAIVLGGLYLLPTLFAILYASAIGYGLFLFIPFLYYFTFGVSRLRKNRGAYVELYHDVDKRLRNIAIIKHSNSGLRLRNDGSYDERSNAGKQANRQLSSENNQLSKSLKQLLSYLSTYQNACFLAGAIWGYLITIVALAFFGSNPDYAPIIAVSVSVLLGFSARSLGTFEEVDGEWQPKNLPQIERKPFLFNFVALIAMNVFTLAVYTDKDSSWYQYFYPIEESLTASQNGKQGDNISDVIQLNNLDGFIIKDTIAFKTIKGEDSFVITNGQAVTITGEVPEMNWYKIIPENTSDSVYVNKANVAVFSQ